MGYVSYKDRTSSPVKQRTGGFIPYKERNRQEAAIGIASAILNTPQKRLERFGRSLREVSEMYIAHPDTKKVEPVEFKFKEEKIDKPTDFTTGGEITRAYIPEKINTGGLLKDLVIGAVRAIPRGLVSSIEDIRTPKQPNIPTIYQPSGLEKIMLGDEPIESLQTKMTKWSGITENYMIEHGMPPGAASAYAPLYTAPVLAAFMAAEVDINFFSTGKKTITKLSRMSKVGDVSKELKSLGLSKDIVNKYKYKIAKTSDKGEINKMLKNIKKKIRDGEKRALEITSLTNDAVKFDNADDFVKAKKGTTKLTDKQLQIVYKNSEKIYIKEVDDTGAAVKKQMIRDEKLATKRAGRLAIETRVIESMGIKIGKAILKTEMKWMKKLFKINDNIVDVIRRIDKLDDAKKSIRNIALDIGAKNKDVIRLVSAIDNAKTIPQVMRIISRVKKVQEKVVRTGVLKNIIKNLKDIDSLPATWRNGIEEVMSGKSVSAMRANTLKQAKELSDFVAKEKDTLYKLGRKNLALLKKAEDIGKTPLRSLSTEDLIRLNKKIDRLKREGIVANKVRKNIIELQPQLALQRLKKTSVNLDTKPPNVGKGLSKKDRDGSVIFQTMKRLREGKLKVYTMDIVIQLLDGMKRGENYKFFKERWDDAFQNAKSMKLHIAKQYVDAKRGIEEAYNFKFKEENMTRIMVHAAKKQRGGYSKLKSTGMTVKQIDSVVLNDAELELYNYMRSKFDELEPMVRKTLKDVHGEDLGHVDNYFSFKSDYTSDADMATRLKGDYNARNRVQQGFKHERIDQDEGFNLSMMLNAENVFMKHIDDATYFIHGEEVVNSMGKVVKSKEYGKLIGKNAQDVMREWVDIQARKGVPAGYKHHYTDTVLNNIGAGILGFRLSPILKQTLAKVTSSMLVGKHAFRHNTEFFTNNLSKYVQKASKQQSNRTLDDPAFEVQAKNKKIAEIQKAGYYGMKVVDQQVADNVWYSAYRKYFDDNKMKFNLDDFKAGKVDEKARKYSDYITRRTQGSGEYKDIPLMLSGKDKRLYRNILKFQNFILNESFLVTHDVIGKTLLKEKNPVKAAAMMTAFLAGALAETYITTGMAQLFSSKKYAKEEREKKMGDRLIDGIVGKVPGVNNIYSGVRFDSTGFVLPDTIMGTYRGGKSLFTGKKTDTKIRGASRMLENLSNLFIGLPGSGQAGQLFRKYGIGEPKKSSSKKRRPSSNGLINRIKVDRNNTSSLRKRISR